MWDRIGVTASNKLIGDWTNAVIVEKLTAVPTKRQQNNPMLLATMFGSTLFKLQFDSCQELLLPSYHVIFEPRDRMYSFIFIYLFFTLTASGWKIYMRHKYIFPIISPNCQSVKYIHMMAHFIGAVPQNSVLPLMASEDTPSRRLCHPLRLYSAGRIFCEAKKRIVLISLMKGWYQKRTNFFRNTISLISPSQPWLGLVRLV